MERAYFFNVTPILILLFVSSIKSKKNDLTHKSKNTSQRSIFYLEFTEFYGATALEIVSKTQQFYRVDNFELLQ